MLNDQKLYMCITHSMILVSRYKGKLHGGKRGHQILTRSPPPFGQCLKKTFLAWRGAPLFLLSLLSLAAIGYKYLLSKVNYDISLDIFPTCTFADTRPPDARWFIIHLKMPVSLYRVQGAAWYLLDVKYCKKLFVCKSSSSLQQFRALFNFAMYMIDGEARIRNYFNDFQHNHHDYSHKNLK